MGRNENGWNHFAVVMGRIGLFNGSDRLDSSHRTQQLTRTPSMLERGTKMWVLPNMRRYIVVVKRANIVCCRKQTSH
jgi:hypothetical protein